jgi:hypothetical protein
MLLSILFKLRPHVLRDGEDGGAGAGGGTGTGNPEKDNANGGADKRTFTQTELDALFAERARQAKQSGIAELLKELGVENPDQVKAALKAAEDAKKAQMTELEKAQAEAAEARKKAEEAEAARQGIEAKAAEKLLRAAIIAEASKAGFNDPNDAWLYIDRSAIKAKDDDSYEGLDKAIEAVVKAKPYLVKQQQQGSNQGTPRRERGKPNPDKSQGGQGEQPQPATINF